MKLILLPGMDGTGRLFDPLIQTLKSVDCQVLALPDFGSQDYTSLVQSIRTQLPDEPCVLLGESFSGPIAAQLASVEQVKGVIFVATFLRPPAPLLLKFSSGLPIKLMARMPGSTWALQSMMFGHQASPELLKTFREIIEQVYQQVLKQRLKTIQSLNLQIESCSKPALFILPQQDRLVPQTHHQGFKDHFSELQVRSINGPHFILQVHPKRTASLIEEFMNQLQDHLHSKQ